MNDKIDVVILWVDGDDPIWKEKYAGYKNVDNINSIRYRDYGTLKYLFRSIETYASWVNRIHFITDHQKPKWLNIDNPKLNIVSHEDFIPRKYLPTFNSNTIELNLFRLSDLSEKFILFNDDTFLNNKVEIEDFFENDKIKDYGIYNRIAPNEEFSHTLLNNLIIINRHFNKRESISKNWKKMFQFKYGSKMLLNIFTLPWKEITGYYNPHFPQPHLKSVLLKLYNLETESFERTFQNKFRGYESISHWLCRYWLLEEGKYIPQSLSIGRYLLISDEERITREIFKGKSKFLCINDIDCDEETFHEYKNVLQQKFQQKFPIKSSFEK